MDASGKQPYDRVNALLRLGERLGYLTYEMLNDQLPDEIVTAEKLDLFPSDIDRRGIRLIDEAESPGLG